MNIENVGMGMVIDWSNGSVGINYFNAFWLLAFMCLGVIMGYYLHKHITHKARKTLKTLKTRGE